MNSCSSEINKSGSSQRMEKAGKVESKKSARAISKDNHKTPTLGQTPQTKS